MKSFQNSFSEYEYFITPSDIIEFMYCQRFIYFMKFLGIPQFEEKRYKVQLGRDIHDKKSIQNKEYLRKKIGSVKKESNVYLVLKNIGLRGIVDEVHTLVDGTMAPLDYKFAKYEDKVYQTYKNQMILYSLMIEEVYGKIVNKAFLVYCRDGNKLVDIEVNNLVKKEVISNIQDYKKVINGFFPKATKYKARCIDCCYKNICIK